jgi:alkylhydroperoxidase/carboxymuconolactone decarboxylase family protein YurZ
MEQSFDRVEYMRQTRPDIAEELRRMAQAIYASDALDLKTKHLIVIGIIAALRNMDYSLRTHVHKALEANATKEEILTALTLAMPYAGSVAVVAAFPVAIAAIEEFENA